MLRLGGALYKGDAAVLAGDQRARVQGRELGVRVQLSRPALQPRWAPGRGREGGGTESQALCPRWFKELWVQPRMPSGEDGVGVP